ncbi:MAG TPA: phosphatase PAP2 family protein [Actinomycetota bacterium]
MIRGRLGRLGREHPGGASVLACGSGIGSLGRAAVRAALRLDQDLFDRAARRHSPLLDQALPCLTRTADYGMLWMAIAGALALAGGPRGRRAAQSGLIAIAITSALANQLAKRSFDRRRPLLASVPLVRRAQRMPTSASFPSGHAASAAAFATALATTAPATAVPVGMLAAGVSYSRVHTGVHYPADVAAGALLGFSVGLLVGRRARRRR